MQIACSFLPFFSNGTPQLKLRDCSILIHLPFCNLALFFPCSFLFKSNAKITTAEQMFLLNRCYSLSDFWNVLSKLHIRKRCLRIIIVFPTYIRAFEIRDLSKNKNQQEDPFCRAEQEWRNTSGYLLTMRIIYSCPRCFSRSGFHFAITSFSEHSESRKRITTYFKFSLSWKNFSPTRFQRGAIIFSPFARLVS